MIQLHLDETSQNTFFLLPTGNDTPINHGSIWAEFFGKILLARSRGRKPYDKPEIAKSPTRRNTMGKLKKLRTCGLGVVLDLE
jgi:hypothetical protein